MAAVCTAEGCPHWKMRLLALGGRIHSQGETYRAVSRDAQKEQPAGRPLRRATSGPVMSTGQTRPPGQAEGVDGEAGGGVCLT